MTNPNNNPENWEPSTTNRDKLKKDSFLINAAVETLNLAISAYNNSIGRLARLAGAKKIEHVSADEIIEAAKSGSGGVTFALGVIDSAAKLAGKIPIVGILAAPIEIACDHLKDLINSMGMAGLAADIGDLKEGQAKLNAKVDAQGKRLSQKMDSIKSELRGELKQQGEEFNKKIKDLDKRLEKATGENRRLIEKEKKQRQAEYQELKNSIAGVANDLNQVEKQLTNAFHDFRNEVDERFAEQEQKILNNKRKIEEEKIKREEEIKETHDRIKLTTTNLENLRQEKEQLEDEFINYKSQINQQTTDTQQAFQDLEAEYQRKTKIIEAQIEDNQETLQEFSAELDKVRREQAFQREQQDEILEELQENNDLLFIQQHKLNLVAQQMEEISEEIHGEMSQIKKDQTSLFNLTQNTTKKVDHLTQEVKNIWTETENLQAQIKKNKKETELAKQEAKWANERIDNLLKAQALADYSSEQSKLDKIQKSLELKAEETKLLATLNLLKETKQLIPLEFSEREWKVGTEEGTKKDMPRPEGYLLSPNSRWTKMYTPEQLQEWGWDTRLLGEHEKAPLTDDEDKRKPKQVDPSSNQKSEEQEEQKETNNSFLEKFTELEKETLARLQEIQQQISQNIQAVENSPSPLPSATQQKTQAIQQEIKEKKQQLKKKQQEIKKLEKKSTSTKNHQQLEQVREEKEEVKQKLEQLQAQLSDPGLQLDQEIEKLEAETVQKEQEELEKQWETIQALSQQALQEKFEEEPEEKETKENNLDKKLEELIQQLKEMEQSAAASQKTMTYFMLFLIIFLLEYVVYKRNGLPGLVILNVILSIAYYYRETLKEYADLWGKYLLIIGYVMGNVLAYSAPEQEKYKWPSVAGFNIAILAIYAYTLYQQKQEQAKIEAHYQKESEKISQEVNLPPETLKQIPSEDNSLLSTLNPLVSNNISQRAEKFSEVVKEQLAEQEIIRQKELELQQQKETLQKAAEIEEKLKEAQDSLGTSSMSWNKIYETYPEFKEKSILLKEFEKIDQLLGKDVEPTKSLLVKLEKIPLSSKEEQQILASLYLTPEQFISISCQAQNLTPEEKEEITNNYSLLTTSQKLQLINSGLNNLGVDTFEKKENFVQLNHQLYQEKKNFGLTIQEKEGVLRLLINTLNLNHEQRNSLENMGVSFFDASNWKVSEKQKNKLLEFGLGQINLTQEQQANLTHVGNLKTFSLHSQQKNILTNLAPLLKENRYSEEALELINFLDLKFSSLSFLVNNQIIPNPQTDFGKVPNPYLTLKTKFLEGEQKVLREEAKGVERKLKEEEIQEQKVSIIKSLLDLAHQRKQNQSLNISLLLDSWVKIGVLQAHQKNILLTLGFKTVPKYNYWQLLIFAVENFTDYSWDNFLKENGELEEDYQEYLNSLTARTITINKTIWEKFVSSWSKKERQVFKDLNLEELINEKINQALVGYQSPEKFYDSQEEFSETEETPDPKPTPSTSRYDELLENMNDEEKNRQQKKKVREESKKKLEEAERKRRQEKLLEKDQKLKEDEERRKQERELAEQEEKKRQEAEAARQKALQEEQEALFQKKMANIEAAKKRAEEALANQIKQNELEEQKKRDEIARLEKENQAEQERLKKQTELIEEEKQKKLAAIALEDEEQRQLIEKRANEEKARIETEVLETKRKNEAELKKKANELFKQREEKQRKIEQMEQEARIANEDAQAAEELFRQEQAKAADLYAAQQRQYQKRMKMGKIEEAASDNQYQAMRSVLNYYVNEEEFNKSFQGASYPDSEFLPQVNAIFNKYPYIKVNIANFFVNSGKNKVLAKSNQPWTYYLDTDLQKTCSAVGSNWLTKQELEERIKRVIGEKF